MTAKPKYPISNVSKSVDEEPDGFFAGLAASDDEKLWDDMLSSERPEDTDTDEE